MPENNASHVDQALDWAMDSNDSAVIAHTYALLHIGDQLKELVAALPTLAMLHRPLDEIPDAQPEPEQPNAESPAEADATANGYYLPNGRPYRPATNPEDWRLDVKTGEYVSPAGRRYHPRATHAVGMLRKLQRKNLSVKLYDPEERDAEGRLLDSAKAVR